MFTTHLRPGPRVRYMPADDAATLEDSPLTKGWLVDSHGILCLVCSAKLATAAQAVDHRWTCTP